MKTARIVNGEIENVIVTDDEWTPPDDHIYLPLSEALSNGYNFKQNNDSKIWASKKDFDNEFTDQEMYAIEVNTNPVLIILRSRLNRWEGIIHSTDERVQLAFSKLVSEGIISEERKEEILNN